MFLMPMERTSLARALRYLGYRSRSEHEVREHLRKHGFPDEAIDGTLVKLRAWGYVDDRRFAKDWVADRLASGRAGKERLRLELLHRGIREEIVNEVLAAIPEERETEAARAAASRWMERKTGSNLSQEQVRRRLWAYLTRCGYGTEVVSQVVRELTGPLASP